MMYIKRNGKAHIIFGYAKENKELNTKVGEKAQKEYKKKCEQLNLKYKPIADTPKQFKGFNDENIKGKID